jgi:excisionase family DNA binding protein
MERLLYRVNEAAEILGMSKSKAYEMIAGGELPYIRVRDSIRIPRADLELWIEQRKEDARQPGSNRASSGEEGTGERTTSR